MAKKKVSNPEDKIILDSQLENKDLEQVNLKQDEIIENEIKEVVKKTPSNSSTKKTTTRKPRQAKTPVLKDINESVANDEIPSNVEESKKVTSIEPISQDLSVKEEIKEIEVKEDIKQDEIKEESQPDVLPSEPTKKTKKEKKPKLSKEYLKTPITRVETLANVGLSDSEVQERLDKGYSNAQPNIITKSYFSIFRSNILTLFNLVNIFLAVAVMSFGALKNALFIVIVAANVVIGVFQEIRSKMALDKMSLLTSPNVDVVRNSTIYHIPTADIVLDDIIILKQGSQVPADCVVVEGICEANESLLTGEQDDIHKKPGDELLSGSTIPSGEARCRVTAVGANSYSSQLLAEAKKFKKAKSELMKSINWIIRIITILIFPLGIMMFISNYNSTGHDMAASVTGTVASVVGMIPEGLIALTSVALAAGVYKLSKKKTLVQELYSIETLARVDVLCLDKTGTITEGSMQVEQVHVYSSKFGFVDDIMANMVNALGDGGSTFAAFSEYFHTNEVYEVASTIPFSSSRKWSAVDFKDKGRFVVGAPEFVLKEKIGLVENDVKSFTSQGFRVLVLARTTETLKEQLDVDKLRPVALLILSDKIRENAYSTFEYFAKQGVTLKVISGDNPITVSKVAERAGLIGAEKYIDASHDLLTPEQIYDACDKYTIFGRVSPKQKKLLVQSLKAKGYTVGMTGDGVNDVMALKEADCSIAMASGSDAARNVAQLVLLDSDFSSLPSVVSEGRRVINNIQRAASLFLVKTTFSAVLSILMVAFSMHYPFEPIQLTLVSTVFVGFPAFILALEPNDTKVTGNFLSTVFKKALPAGFTISLFVFIISYIYSNIGVDVSAQISTMACYIYGAVSFVFLLQVCLPFNKERLFLVTLCLLAFIFCISVGFTRDIFSLVGLTSGMIAKISIIIACVIPTIAVMRVEIEAIRTLFNETFSIFKKGANGAKKVLKNFNHDNNKENKK